MDLRDKQCAVTSLRDALAKFDQGHSDEAISLVTSLKPGANKLLLEAESALEKLKTLEDFYNQQEQFLTHHVQTLERKERELMISKTVSESIQRTQQKKLQACKWDLMKARNALYSTQKSLRRKEREQTVAAGYQCLILMSENGVDDLRTTANCVQIEVNKRELECTNKESFLNDNRKRISEIKEKSETLSKRKTSLKQLRQTCVTDKARLSEVKEYLNKVVSLWALCKKVSGNGCSREDAMRAISKLAKEQTNILPSLLGANETTEEASVLCAYERLQNITANQDLFHLVNFNINCRHCGKAFSYPPDNKHMKCTECSTTDENEVIQRQKVIVEFYECAKDGTITGHVQVSNLAYDKQVFVHHSQNGWITSVNTDARYSSSCKESDCDLFEFQLPFDATLSSSLEFVVCYRVNGLEFWDNNSGQNFTVTL